MRILIVEDDRVFRERLARAVRERGHAAVTATTGAEARALSREGFEGAVVDVRLGGEIGLDLLPHLRATSAPPRIVVMTGQVTPGLLARASAAGAFACLAKPFDVDQLLATLMTTTGEGR
jgi:two-component system response regulator RegA